MEALNLLPKWVTDRMPLTTIEVSERVNFSIVEIRRLVRRGILKPILGRRPYRFDPVHVYQVFFTPQITPVKTEPIRSLKIEDGNSRSHKPVTRKDLWL